MEVAVVAVIFCFVAVAATYIAFNNGGGLASGDGSADIDTAGGMATIGGIVTDKKLNGIPGATVELWEMRLDNATGMYVNANPVAISDNPKATNGDTTVAAIGTYIFIGVLPGLYNVTAEYVDAAGISHRWFRFANVSQSGATIANIAIPDIIIGGLADTAEATPSPRPVNGSADVVTPDSGNASAADHNWGMVAGMVTDKNKNGVPGARVTLREGHINDSGWFINDRIADVENNPQISNTVRDRDALGSYRFDRVPSGIYNVTAEITDANGVGHMWFAIVNATSPGTHTNNIAIPDYVDKSYLPIAPPA
ncbi:MAG: carboxypeptidase-like regulatory domain-containing protein [Methanocella sp.]